VKRRDLVRAVEQAGAVFIRHGGKRDWYQNPVTGISQPLAAADLDQAATAWPPFRGTV
jgi:hypothetical protein